MPKTLRWLVLCALVLGLVLVPFLLFGAPLEAWTDAFLESAAEHSFPTAVVISSLLASDILLPVPSSVLSTGAGFTLGFLGGFAASCVGMSIGCMIGYGLGARSGRGLSRRLLGAAEAERLECLNKRFGDWAIVISRPIPILAEASVLFAGVGAMPMSRFVVLSTLSNAGISAVYAAVGAYSASMNSFLLAFAASVLIPFLAMAGLWTLKKAKDEVTT